MEARGIQQIAVFGPQRVGNTIGGAIRRRENLEELLQTVHADNHPRDLRNRQRVPQAGLQRRDASLRQPAIKALPERRPSVERGLAPLGGHQQQSLKEHRSHVKLDPFGCELGEPAARDQTTIEKVERRLHEITREPGPERVEL
jgi:hypothetical protein